MREGNAGQLRSVDRAYGHCKQDGISLTLSVPSMRTRPRIGMLAIAVVSGHGGAAHAGASRNSARSTAALVIGTWGPCVASGCAWAIARARPWPATAAARAVPRSTCATAVRQCLPEALQDGTADLIPRRVRMHNAPGCMEGYGGGNPGRAQARIHCHPVRRKTLAHGETLLWGFVKQMVDGCPLCESCWRRAYRT